MQWLIAIACIAAQVSVIHLDTDKPVALYSVLTSDVAWFRVHHTHYKPASVWQPFWQWVYIFAVILYIGLQLMIVTKILLKMYYALEWPI